MSPKNGKHIFCSYCTKKFYIAKCKFEEKRFCSRKCQYDFLRKTHEWGFKNYAQNFPYNRYKRISIKGKWKYEHRILMEKHLGRKLRAHEFIHHINEDPRDNRIENLMIVTNASHGRIHKRES